jgi:hypothetical protein
MWRATSATHQPRYSAGLQLGWTAAGAPQLAMHHNGFRNCSTVVQFYGEITQQLLKNAAFPGSNNGTGLFQVQFSRHLLHHHASHAPAGIRCTEWRHHSSMLAS